MRSERGASTKEFIADASVGVAWSVLSQATGATEELLDRVDSGTQFAVPALWPFEVANALLILARRNRITPEEFARARLKLGGLIPHIDAEGPRFAWAQVTDLAVKFGLTVYDAAYLELAIRRGVALASRDASLNQAARRSGVKTLL